MCDYALARLASLATALFLVLMVPMIALFVGDVLMKPDTFKAIGNELPQALPAFPAYFLVAVSMASIALALSAVLPAARLLGHRPGGLLPPDGSDTCRHLLAWASRQAGHGRTSSCC